MDIRLSISYWSRGCLSGSDEPSLTGLPDPEAPVSWNVRYTSSQGYDCQLTLRGIDPAEVLKLAEQLMGKMGEAGVGNVHGQSHGNGSAPTKTDAAWCQIHGCAMTRYEKNGRSWFSHRVQGGKWCKGR